MGKTALILTVLFTLPAWGQAISFERDVLFAKVKDGEALRAHPLIKKSRKLFGRLHEIKTTDAILLENDLRRNDSIEWVEKSFFERRQKLETLKNLPANVHKAAARGAFGFDDPIARELWGFGPSARHGVSAEMAYQSMPAWEPVPVVVAVIDTGVDYNHADLKERMWQNPGEVPGNGIDDDRNGFIDDVYGVDILNGDSDPRPTHFHGTHVAGTIAAQQNNGIGVAGIAANARIMALRTIPDDSDETDRDVINSFLYAQKNGARIVNCSFGKYRQGRAVKETINHIGEKGVLTVAAAGNDSNGGSNDWFNIDRRTHFPSSFDSESMLVVTATREGGGLADFANVGTKNVDVAAPGDYIYSTIPGGRYGTSSGTSMATPLVAGIAAQILSYYPALTPIELKTVIMQSVVPVDSLRTKVRTGGRVDLAKAMEYARTHYSHR